MEKSSFSKVLCLNLDFPNLGWCFSNSNLEFHSAIEMGLKLLCFSNRGGQNTNLRYRDVCLWLEKQLSFHEPDLVLYVKNYMSDLVLCEKSYGSESKYDPYIPLGFYTRILEQCAFKKIEVKSITPESLKSLFTGNLNADRSDVKEKALTEFDYYLDYDFEDKRGVIASSLGLLKVFKNHPGEFELKPEKKKPIKKTEVKIKFDEHCVLESFMEI